MLTFGKEEEDGKVRTNLNVKHILNVGESESVTLAFNTPQWQ